MNRIYLVRHGENVANITKEFSHRKVDYSLTPKGVLQARQTAEFLRGKGLHEIYSSPLRRAVETAEIVAQDLGLEVTVLEELRELNVGSLEDLPPDDTTWSAFFEVVRGWAAGRVEATFPGGENYLELRKRTRVALEQILAGRTGRNLLVVGHGGTLAAAVREICGDGIQERTRGRENHNCAITEVLAAIREGRPVGSLITWASHSHLHGPAAELVSGVLRQGPSPSHSPSPSPRPPQRETGTGSAGGHVK